MYYKPFMMATLVALAACGSTTPNSTTSTSSSNAADTSTNPPVETRAPNSPDYKPAFAGQTRIGGVTTTTPYEGRAISTGLTRPWGITTMPDGRLLVTEKGGTMRIATTEGQLSNAITGVPPVVAAGQGGLLGVTLDPAFATNRMVYW